jgi:hypothetical protein
MGIDDLNSGSPHKERTRNTINLKITLNVIIIILGYMSNILLDNNSYD